MISSALSRIFWFAFVLIIIGGIGNIISQVTGKPLKFKPSKNSVWTFGRPGLVLNSQVTNRQNEKFAPDTSVDYSYVTRLGAKGNGSFTLNENDFHNYKTDLSTLIEEKKLNGEEIKLDTQVTFIGEMKWENIDYSTLISGVDSIEENKFVSTESYRDEKNKKIKELKDTFSTRDQAERFLYLSRYNTSYKISDEMDQQQTLRILPANKWQHFFFIMCELIIVTSWALLFLSLSRLFKNFFNQSYFTSRNINLLKKLGWYILIPQFVTLIFYWLLLYHIHPAKVFVSYTAIHNIKLLAQYDFKSGIEWQLVFIGLSIIVLSYIFKDGLKMKEENELTV